MNGERLMRSWRQGSPTGKRNENKGPVEAAQQDALPGGFRSGVG
jgi:hypothetical protein